MEGEPVSTRSIEVTQLTLSYTVGHNITQLFFKRFLSVAAERIHTLCQHLEFTEKQMEFVWEINKFLICEEIEILICRHLDHLIICSIYAVIKKCGEGYDSFKFRKFNDIFKEKRDINDHNIPTADGKTVGFVEFYNIIFLDKTRNFIQNYNLDDSRNPTPLRRKNLLQKMNLDSQLKQNIQSISKKADMKAEMKIPNSFALATPPPASLQRTLFSADSPHISKTKIQGSGKNAEKLINFDNYWGNNQVPNPTVTMGAATILSGLIQRIGGEQSANVPVSNPSVRFSPSLFDQAALSGIQNSLRRDGPPGILPFSASEYQRLPAGAGSAFTFSGGNHSANHQVVEPRPTANPNHADDNKSNGPPDDSS